MGASLERCSRHVQLGGGLGEDPQLGGEIISLHWHLERFGIPQSELVNVARQRVVWVPLLDHDLDTGWALRHLQHDRQVHVS